MYHRSKPRTPARRERKSIHILPVNYVLMDRKEEVRCRIGMAVCRRGSQIIFEVLLKTSTGIFLPVHEKIYPRNKNAEAVTGSSPVCSCVLILTASQLSFS